MIIEYGKSHIQYYLVRLPIESGNSSILLYNAIIRRRRSMFPDISGKCSRLVQWEIWRLSRDVIWIVLGRLVSLLQWSRFKYFTLVRNPTELWTFSKFSQEERFNVVKGTSDILGILVMNQQFERSITLKYLKVCKIKI